MIETYSSMGAAIGAAMEHNARLAAESRSESLTKANAVTAVAEALADMYGPITGNDWTDDAQRIIAEIESVGE